jgi:selenium-binding protein 1
MPFELRPARNPAKAYGFVGVVISLEDLSSSIWMWYLDQAGNGGAGDWKIVKVIDIPAEPADPADLPPMLQGFKAAAPLVTDINLSLDDRFLYVSCWGTGELRQYDVSDPFHPRFTGSVRIGGMVGRDAHPARPGRALGGGPQMVELSRDGRRVYVTNGLYTAVDSQFYPDGFNGWMVKADVSPDGGIALDPKFFLELEDGMRTHQVRLQGGDASSDSFCYPS